MTAEKHDRHFPRPQADLVRLLKKIYPMGYVKWKFSQWTRKFYYLRSSKAVHVNIDNLHQEKHHVTTRLYCRIILHLYLEMLNAIVEECKWHTFVCISTLLSICSACFSIVEKNIRLKENIFSTCFLSTESIYKT